LRRNKNIVLIGMCGAGKSTVGVLLAKTLGFHFLDTDVFIQAVEGKGLQELIDELGIERFCLLEEKHILQIKAANTVIATGGSAVYSDRAMSHLAKSGVVVHLNLEYDEVERRVKNLYTRGVVMGKGQTLKSLYIQRHPLYEKYAQMTIDCTGKTHEQVVEEIIGRLQSV
jgi:shikimate kinase